MLKLLIHLAGGFLAPVSMTIVSLLLPDISRDYSLSLGQSSLVPVFRSAGEFIGALLSGVTVYRYGPWRTFLAGHGCMALACLALFWPTSYIPFLMLILVAGVGTAFIVTTLTSFLAGLDPNRSGRYVGLSFFTIAAGQVVWPMAMGWRLEAGDSWRIVAVGIGITAMALLVAQSVSGPLSKAGQHSSEGPSMKEVMKDSRLWGIAGVMMLWMASHMVVMVWLPTYVINDLSAGKGAASLVLSAYMGGVVVSRFAMMRLSDRHSPRRLLLIGCSAAAVLMTGFFLVEIWEFVVALMFLVGVFNGAGVPLFVSLAGYQMGNSPGVFGALMAMSLVSVTLSPGVAGWIAQYYGLKAAFFMVPASLVGTVALLTLFVGSSRGTAKTRLGV